VGACEIGSTAYISGTPSTKPRGTAMKAGCPHSKSRPTRVASYSSALPVAPSCTRTVPLWIWRPRAVLRPGPQRQPPSGAAVVWGSS
jgi:hypothetical protein